MNVHGSLISSSGTPKPMSPARAIRMVGLEPMRSSAKANPAAPSPAVTLRPMAKRMIWSKLMPKVQPAYSPPTANSVASPSRYRALAIRKRTMTA